MFRKKIKSEKDLYKIGKEFGWAYANNSGFVTVTEVSKKNF